MKTEARLRLDRRGRAALDALTPDPAGLCAGRAGGAGRVGGDTTETTAALTGSTIGHLPLAHAEDIAAVTERSRTVQREWATTDITDRAKLLLAFNDLVVANRDAILDLVQWESGKSRTDAQEEVTDVSLTALYYAKNAKKALEPRRVHGAIPLLTKTTVRYQPKGVVAVISPWNYPLTLAISDALPALVAGNAVVLKPDSQTPHIALAMKALLERAGFPKDLFQVVVGRGSELGPQLVATSDYLMFTGSTATGRILGKQAGEALIGFSAELGGKNPMIVRADALAQNAARGAVNACFANSGQLCISIERIYVNAKIWDEFVPAFVRETEKVRVGASMDWADRMGPLISSDQLEKVTAHVDDAVANGAKVLAGGQRLPEVSPTAYAPTILTDVPESATLYREETFGPVVSLYKVRDDDEAVRLANDTEYGLNASVWTGNLADGEALAQQIKSGSVNVNDGYSPTWASTGAPVGGLKQSGLSHRHGTEGIRKYCDIHTTAVQRIMPIAAPSWLGQKRWGSIMTAFIKLKRIVPFV